MTDFLARLRSGGARSEQITMTIRTRRHQKHAGEKDATIDTTSNAMAPHLIRSNS
jgi:hypothetical protein